MQKKLELNNLEETVSSLIQAEVNSLAARRARGQINQRKLSNKRVKVNPDELDLTPVLQGILQIKHGTPKGKQIRILVDTGASHSVVEASLCSKLRQKRHCSMI